MNEPKGHKLDVYQDRDHAEAARKSRERANNTLKWTGVGRSKTLEAWIHII